VQQRSSHCGLGTASVRHGPVIGITGSTGKNDHEGLPRSVLAPG
jgi:hypothetical protein